jgi:DNA-binding response OmpR family regulator
MERDDIVDAPSGHQRRRTDGARILVIDDSDDLRTLMEFALEQEGYVVDGARSAEDAIRLLERQTYSLVLSDYALPGQSGIWLLSEALERGLLRGAVTRLVTADPDAPRLASGVDVVRKPVDFEQFLPQVRAILADSPATSTGARASSPPEAPIELVLYVSPRSLPCARAARVMKRLLRRYDDRHVRFAICDVAADPAQAALDRVVFTPSLVKRHPSPRMWVLGDLAQDDAVTSFLSACGLSEAPRTRPE